MSTRDELIESLDQDKFWDIGDGYAAFIVHKAADALIAEGWRKKPSREELFQIVMDIYAHYYTSADDSLDAILALMDRGQ